MLGDVLGILDASGTLVAEYQYDAYGKHVMILDGNGNDVSTNYAHIANVNPIRYRGYYYDIESGFYYLNSRYYDPEIGRFINADGFVSTGQGILGTNMFAYCGNNPVNRKDPSGQWWLTALIVTAVVITTHVIRKEQKVLNKKNNTQIDQNTKTSTKNKIVDNQSDENLKDFEYGSYSVAHNGCEAIAVHNAKIINGMESTLSETITDFHDAGAMIGVSGYFGSNPYKIGKVLSNSGIDYSSVGLNELTSVGTYIISYWNPDAPWNGLHTVAVYYDGNSYTTYNRSGGISLEHPSMYAGNYICGYYLR